MSKLAVSAKGEALPDAFLRPLGMPPGVDPRVWRKAARERIEALLDASWRLIDALDSMEADCDMEDDGTAEHWLGWTERGPWLGSDNTDRELDDSDDEDGGDTEPTLGAPERHPTSREPTYSGVAARVGSGLLHHERLIEKSQAHWADGARGDHEREEENEHGGDILDEPR